MKPITMTKKQYDDQNHINDAYANVKAALNELVQVREMDGELHRLLKDMYRFEDTLWQYVGNTDYVKVV